MIVRNRRPHDVADYEDRSLQFQLGILLGIACHVRQLGNWLPTLQVHHSLPSLA